MISHLNINNKPTTVDISNKKQTTRIAKAQGIIQFSKKTFTQINKFKTRKGEISNAAIIAGILGAKKTSEIVPLSHNIVLENIDIDIHSINEKNIFVVTCLVKSTGKTGVEMEALTGVAVACLTIYDMCKYLDKSIVIKEIKLLEKKGGKSDFLKS